MLINIHTSIGKVREVFRTKLCDTLNFEGSLITC